MKLINNEEYKDFLVIRRKLLNDSIHTCIFKLSIRSKWEFWLHASRNPKGTELKETVFF